MHSSTYVFEGDRTELILLYIPENDSVLAIINYTITPFDKMILRYKYRIIGGITQ